MNGLVAFIDTYKSQPLWRYKLTSTFSGTSATGNLLRVDGGKYADTVTLTDYEGLMSDQKIGETGYCIHVGNKFIPIAARCVTTGGPVLPPTAGSTYGITVGEAPFAPETFGYLAGEATGSLTPSTTPAGADITGFYTDTSGVDPLDTVRLTVSTKDPNEGSFLITMVGIASPFSLSWDGSDYSGTATGIEAYFQTLPSTQFNLQASP